jgi:hypothetical protein
MHCDTRADGASLALTLRAAGVGLDLMLAAPNDQPNFGTGCDRRLPMLKIGNRGSITGAESGVGGT